jgi:hypothetical protein
MCVVPLKLFYVNICSMQYPSLQMSVVCTMHPLLLSVFMPGCLFHFNTPYNDLIAGSLLFIALCFSN